MIKFAAYVKNAFFYYKGKQLPVVTQLDTETIMKPKTPSQINVDVTELPEILTSSSSTNATKIAGTIVGLSLLTIIAVVIPVVVTQMLKNTTTTIQTTVMTTTATTATTTTATTATTTTATTSTSTTTTTTRTPRYMQITGVNDTVVGIYNTSAGLSSGAWIGSYPSSENPSCVFDNDVNSKYLNFGYGGTSPTVGTNTGFYVTPNVGRSLATGILFATANDHADRDPIAITIEGSNNATAQLPFGYSWTLIYNGSTGISSSVDPGRNTYVLMQNFSNTIVYISYRLLITSQRGSDNSVQYSEANIYGIA